MERGHAILLSEASAWVLLTPAPPTRSPGWRAHEAAARRGRAVHRGALLARVARADARRACAARTGVAEARSRTGRPRHRRRHGDARARGRTRVAPPRR